MMRFPDKPGAKQSRRNPQTFFVTLKTSQGKALLQSERMANLFIDVLRSFVGDRRFKVNEFVIMRNFVQLLLTVYGEHTIEQILRHVKARSAFRVRAEFEIRGWIWEFESRTVRVTDRASYLKYKTVIEEQPIKAGMAESAETYPYCSAYLRKQKSQAKAAGG